MQSNRFGVSVSHYGGLSVSLAELQRELVRNEVKILDLVGCPYPEMARAEQVRQARAGGVETVVLLDSHVEADYDDILELVHAAELHGVVTMNDPSSPWALECAAIRRDVLEAVVRGEEREYGNSAVVDTNWGGTKVAAVPVASPWHRSGAALEPSWYMTESQALLWRAKESGFIPVQFRPDGVKAFRRSIRASVENVDVPKSGAPGSEFALCIPTFGGLDIDQQRAVAQLEKAGMVVFRIHDCPWIDQGRSWLAERALSVGRGVFFLDHDIQFQPNDVLRLCEQALERNAVVAGAYCMRRSGKNLIGSFDLPPGPLTFFEGGDTHPAYYSGLGFAAVPKRVLEDIELPKLYSDALGQTIGWGDSIRPWFALDCSTGFYAGEDVSFCNRVHDLTVKMIAADAGYEPQWGLSHSGRPARVFLDSRVRIFHRGQYDYGIEDAGIVVPRIESLTTVMTSSRREARELLVNALDLPAEVKLDAMEFAEA